MRRTRETEQFVVYDEFLSTEEYQAFFNYLENTNFRPVHVPTMKGAYRIEDENVVLGPQFIWPMVPIEQVLPNWNEIRMPPGYLFYPTKTPADVVLERIRSLAGEHRKLVGVEAEDWIGITGQPQLNPAGSGISWHRDQRTYTGAFVYYAHPEWNAQWGGELMISEPGTKEYFPDLRRAHTFDNRLESEALLRTGIGTYIAPKPNRLVLLEGRDPHAVAKVTKSAGHHVRIGFAGFFVAPAYVGDLLERLRQHNDL